MNRPTAGDARLLSTTTCQWALLIVLCLCAGWAQAAELAHLTNGFSMRCERHEQSDGNTRLYLSGSGFVDVPTADISGFEPAPAAPAPATAASIHEHISRASAQTGIDPDFIHSVVKAESGYNPQAVSPKGAQGLMQLMPSTASRLGVSNSLDPATNVDGGSRYLRELLLRYDGDAQKALAAYNAGPERVEQYKGVPPYRETRAYVTRVINDYNRRKLAAGFTADPTAGGQATPSQQHSRSATTAAPHPAQEQRSSKRTASANPKRKAEPAARAANPAKRRKAKPTTTKAAPAQSATTSNTPAERRAASAGKHAFTRTRMLEGSSSTSP